MPVLPFLGNWLVGLTFLPNSSVPADITAVYAVGFRRQTDCSLDEDYVVPFASTPNAGYVTSFTGAQDYLHELAGLTTTEGIFPNGCGYQKLGLPASNSILLLGTTAGGATISAELANSGLYVTVTDLTANTVTNTQVTSGSNPGNFSGWPPEQWKITTLLETGLIDPANSMPATAALLGNGVTLLPAVYYDVADTSGTPGGFVIDDVNGDGIPDIVIPVSSGVTNNGYPIFTGIVTTLVGKGDGTFTTGPVSNATWTDSLLPVTGVFKTGDVKDLLIGGTVLFGMGNGSFYSRPNQCGYRERNKLPFPGAVGSLRNNGKLDLVVTQSGFVSIYFGNGVTEPLQPAWLRRIARLYACDHHRYRRRRQPGYLSGR